MPYIVNLATTYDYSLSGTINAFAALCKDYAFLSGNRDYIKWVTLKWHQHTDTLIKPYARGKLSSVEFLDKLSNIFDFMGEMSCVQKHELLFRVWNSSIKMKNHTPDRLALLLKKAEEEPVYLISHTNELNMHRILTLFKNTYPSQEWIEHPDINIINPSDMPAKKAAETPIEIYPNVFLCLSYRFEAFKELEEVNGRLIQQVAEICSGPTILVSHRPEDLEIGRQLLLNGCMMADDFYNQKAPGNKP